MTTQRPGNPPPSRPSRRSLVAWAGAGLAASPFLAAPFAALGPVAADAQGGEGALRFGAATVEALARTLAGSPYSPPQPALPAAFAGLPYDRYVAIKALPEAMAWAGEGRGFVVEPLHRGFVFEAPVSIHLVEDGVARRLAYDASRFDLGKLAPQGDVGDIGFSGFRVHAAGGGEGPVECAIFQGATFFRCVAKGQSYGITARALSLWLPDNRGEEFSAFRAFWIERPEGIEAGLTIHALADSPSATAALRLVLRPGAETLVEVSGRLFARAALGHVGIAGMSATHLLGPAGRRFPDDVRPAAYAATGLRMRNGRGESLWRPVKNPAALEMSLFQDSDPAGFGLMQRDRDYDSFQDDVQRWELRPSLWVEPEGRWGEGAVQLVEIPNASEVNENVLAHWRPKGVVPAGGDLAFAYRQRWCWDGPDPGLARVVNTRIGKGAAARRRVHLVDFRGRGLGETAQPTILVSAVGARVVRQRLWSYPERDTLRVAFETEAEGDAPPEVRLAVAGRDGPVTETWLFR